MGYLLLIVLFCPCGISYSSYTLNWDVIELITVTTTPPPEAIRDVLLGAFYTVNNHLFEIQKENIVTAHVIQRFCCAAAHTKYQVHSQAVASSSQTLGL